MATRVRPERESAANQRYGGSRVGVALDLFVFLFSLPQQTHPEPPTVELARPSGGGIGCAAATREPRMLTISVGASRTPGSSRSVALPPQISALPPSLPIPPPHTSRSPL